MPEADGTTYDVPDAGRLVAPKARPQEHGESRYEQIVDVAAELFRRRDVMARLFARAFGSRAGRSATSSCLRNARRNTSALEKPQRSATRSAPSSLDSSRARAASTRARST